MKRNTCCNCPNVIATKGFIQVVGCDITHNVVPHHADYIANIATFTRVPMDCPLSDEEVNKRPEGSMNIYAEEFTISKLRQV